MTHEHNFKGNCCHREICKPEKTLKKLLHLNNRMVNFLYSTDVCLVSVYVEHLFLFSALQSVVFLCN